jgi:hypothetical protein
METNENLYLDSAKQIIDEVHNTLGKDRDGKTKLEKEGGAMLSGGLRIGKEDAFGEGHYLITDCLSFLANMFLIDKRSKCSVFDL